MIVSSESIEDITKVLKRRFPGRESQIDELACHFCSSAPIVHPLFVSGPRGTGKTTVVRAMVETLRIPYVYITCYEKKTPKAVYSAILQGLQGTKRRREDGYAATARCGTLAEFLEALPLAISRHRKTPWIIIDASHRLGGTELFASLTRIHSGLRCTKSGRPLGEMAATTLGHRGTSRHAASALESSKRSQTCSIGIVFISNVCWSSGLFLSDGNLAIKPHEIQFSSYKAVELQRILLQRMPTDDPMATVSTYRQFLTAVVPSLSRCSENVNDMLAAVQRLWPLYLAPLKEGKQLGPAALFARIRTQLGHMISELDMRTPVERLNRAREEGNPVGDVGQCASKQRHEGGRESDEGRGRVSGISFELPYISKFILLASYIASRNKPTADRAVFDPSFSSGLRKRKDSFMMDRQAEAAQMSVFQGPHSFPLERLLHIFYCIYEQHGPERVETSGSNGLWGENRERSKHLIHEIQRAEVGMQISTLVQLNFLSWHGTDVLENGQYKCHISDELAVALASNVKLRLNDYLKLA